MLTEHDLQRFRDLSNRIHKGQTYLEGSVERPYSVHLDAVEEVLVRFKLATPERRISARFHDAIEDQGQTRDSLRRLGLPEVSIDTVWRVSDEPGANRKERKAKTYPKIAASKEAVITKLCDRVANIEAGLKHPGSSKRDMYRKEQASFYKALYTPDPETAPLWAHIDGLLREPPVLSPAP